MGGRQSKEEIKARKLKAERDEAINRQRFYELNEMRQDWNFVFGDEVPDKMKEVYTIKDVTPRAVWMEDFYIFNQIVAANPDELFHDQSEYALKWIPPGCNFKVMIPFDNPIMMESAIISVNRVLPNKRMGLLFHFAPKNSNQTMFRQSVHPASLVSYHHRPEVLNKLCSQFLEDRMGVEEFRQTIGSHYEVWKRAMYNMLPEDEQVYHTYLTETPEEIGGPARNYENEYLNGFISLQEYHDLKYPDRKKRREAEEKTYPLPYGEGHCIICGNDQTGIIKCNTCDNHVCVSCVAEKFHNEATKTGSYLLIHRLFCLRMAPLKKIQLAPREAPGYLRELRMTGQARALELVEEVMREAERKDEEDEEEEESEDEEEKRYNEEMRLLREKKEYEKMMRENPPALQHLSKVYENKVVKKLRKLRKDIWETQGRIDEPGHTDQFEARLVRLKSEACAKLREAVLHPAEVIRKQALALGLTESTICDDLVEACEGTAKECDWLECMESQEHYVDLSTGKTKEQREDEERERLAAIEAAEAREINEERKRQAREERRRERDEVAAMEAAENATSQSGINVLTAEELARYSSSSISGGIAEVEAGAGAGDV